MSDLDEFIKTVFQELRDGVPILGTDGLLDVTGVDCLPDMHNLEELPRPYRLDLTGADLLPAEGSNEEAELLQESDVCANPSAPNQGYAYNQGFSAFTSNATSSGAVPAYDRYVAATPQALSQTPDCLWPAPHRVLFTQTSADYFSVADESAPLPSIARRKRRLDDNDAEWSTSKHKRWLGASAGEQIPPSAHPVSSMFLGAYGNTEGNTLENNNLTTRTSDSEEKYLATGSIVAVPSSVQGPWPTMSSSVAPATHSYHTQAPYMSAGYNNQAIPLSFSSFGAQPTSRRDVPMLPWGAAPESRQRFNTMPHIPIGNGVNFPQPPFSTAGPSIIHGASLPWMASAEGEDPFLLRSMPSMPVESSLDATFAQPQPSYPARRQEPHRALHTSATEPQPFTFPVTAPTFGALPCPIADRLPPVENASQISGSSTSSTVPSAAKPKRRKQPPRASATTSSSKLPSTPKPKRKKKSPPQTSGLSSSSASTAPSSAEPIKRRRPPQTPYDPDGVGCHICKGGFTRPSEVTKHLKTKKHRLNELAMMFPGLKLSQPKKDIICPIDKCSEGAVKPWLMKRHLEEKHGLIAKIVNAANANDADVERGDDAGVERGDDADAMSMDDADADEDESD